MNERIEKLGEQADLLGECVPTKIPGRYVGYITEDQILKFVELIVRECIELCEQVRAQSVSNGSDDYNHGREMGAEICRNTIFKYFGVE